MTVVDIRWLESQDSDAAIARQIEVGDVSDKSVIPDAFCLFSLEGEPKLCVRLHRNCEESYTFREGQYWSGFLVVGWGDGFYLIDTESSSVIRHELGSYFGSIFADDALLIASGERVFRVFPDGSIAWSSEPVGIDGVMISRVETEFVEGSGEWDPPGGWKPYRLRLADGLLVSGGAPDT